MEITFTKHNFNSRYIYCSLLDIYLMNNPVDKVSIDKDIQFCLRPHIYNDPRYIHYCYTLLKYQEQIIRAYQKYLADGDQFI